MKLTGFAQALRKDIAESNPLPPMMTYSEFIPLHLLITRVYAHPPLPLREGWASAAPKPGFLSGAPGNFWRMQWIPTGTGHELAISDGKIVARSDGGKKLFRVPAAAKKTPVWEDLDASLSFLHAHDAEVGAEIERWLLRSLPVPRAMLTQVWADEAWRSWLTDLVVAAEHGEIAGFLRAANSDGLGIVDLDGESVSISAEQVLIPHPALLTDLDELRAFAVELGIRQRFDQLFREVHRLPSALDPETKEIASYARGEFDQLRFAESRAISTGAKVSGGYAICLCFEDGRPVTARYWIGEGTPDSATVTGNLHWLRNDEIVPVATVDPLAYSEGVRMAAHIYAGRKVTTDKE